MRSSKTKFVLIAAIVSAAGCGGDPSKPGDSCNIDDDKCPEPLACGALKDQNVCLIPAGGSCDLKAESDKQYCVTDGVCEDDGTGAGVCIRHIAEGGACDPANSKFEKCDDGLTCAEVAAGGHKCYQPVFLKGQVFDSATDAGIAKADVIALDEVAAAASDIAVTDAMGNYKLEVPVPRDDKGAPVKTRFFTLRAGAQSYQTFPGGLRTALPISTGDATNANKEWVIQTALTDISLIALPKDQQGLPSISGTVSAKELSGGVLVVAEAGGKGISAISDKKGAYTIFNVPDGGYTVKGYAAGVQLTPKMATVAGMDLVGIDLAQSEAALGSISGKVDIVNPGMGNATSVVLVVESTFSDTFVRGEVPRGLRTPLSGTPDVQGDFIIKDVPEGKYVVLAAFENDYLVRDPDMNISGTQIVHQPMPSPGTAITLASSFKITGSLDIVGPGKDQPEAVTAPVTLSWADDSSEDLYKVYVYNAYGDEVWKNEMVPSVSGGGKVTVMYGGPLDKGMYYQFRAQSWKKSSAISTTEDLRGVFYAK